MEAYVRSVAKQHDIPRILPTVQSAAFDGNTGDAGSDYFGSAEGERVLKLVLKLSTFDLSR